MISQTQLQSKWDYEYNILFEELERFILKWERNLKKCKCDNPECKHYQKEKNIKFGERLKKLFEISIIMNAVSFIKIQKQIY